MRARAPVAQTSQNGSRGPPARQAATHPRPRPSHTVQEGGMSRVVWGLAGLGGIVMGWPATAWGELVADSALTVPLTTGFPEGADGAAEKRAAKSDDLDDVLEGDHVLY
jgi:hypothetical protein